ncbi:Uma2 family endonuclease [Paludisphaera rhizosphaerae]|uniref:Uma2 family endonuclease n=1 Tax=Paludisphaera rhizosphaerae TaxID=2711216 RepID=UPI0013EC3F5A|nr:Uma2 family endonuclease [Paludisphaera rhizosphaerae]
MSTAKSNSSRSSTATTLFVDPYDPLYPSSDGKPMADSTLQFQWIVTIKEGLQSLFEDRADVFVAGDLLWYAVQGDPRDSMAPDVLVVFGRPKGHRRSYRQWVEENVVPQVVFEIDSPSNTAAEMAGKLRRYDKRGVEEYYYYDPETGALKAWLRGPAGLRAIKKTNGWTSPRLGVTFEVPRRKDALILLRPDGLPFRTFGELARDEAAARRIAEAERQRRLQAERKTRLAERIAEAETRRAEVETRRAEAETRRADEERSLREEAVDRAERLAARLRELGESLD